MAKTAPKAHLKAKKREKVIAMFCEGFSQTEIGKKTGVPRSTISGWIKNYKQENPDNEMDTIRREKKAEFAAKAWDVIDDSMELLGGRVKTALEKENELDELLDEVLSDKELNENKKKALIAKIHALQVHNIKDISTVIGTLYDKQALAQGETTQNIGGFEVNIKVVE